MSAEHRRPAAAFVVLALVAAAVVGIQRAEAQGGRLLAAVIGAGVSVHGTLPRVEPLADSVLGDAGLLPGGSFLVTLDVTGADAVAEAEPSDRSVVAAGAVARAAQRSDQTASGPTRRDKADRGRTAHKRDNVKRQVAAAVPRARSAEKGSSARAVPAPSAAWSSRATSALATTSSRSHRPASAPRTVAPRHRPVVRQDHRPVRARVGHNGHAQHKAPRAPHPKAHRAAFRKAFRR
jgi:hypothetical protein